MYAQSVLNPGSFEEKLKPRSAPTVRVVSDKQCPIMVKLGYDPKLCSCDWPEIKNQLPEDAVCVSGDNKCKIVSVDGLASKVNRYRQRQHTLKINRGHAGRTLTEQERETYTKQISQMEAWFSQIAKALSKRWLT